MDNKHAPPITEEPIYGMSRAWLGGALNTARRINRELQERAEGLEVRVNELEGRLAQAEEENHAHARKLVSRDKLVAADTLENAATDSTDLATRYWLRIRAKRLSHEAEGGAA